MNGVPFRCLTKTYWQNNDGELHRLDGPAIEYSNGDKEWWMNNVKYTEEEYEDKLREIKEVEKVSNIRPAIETSKGTWFYFDDIENSYVDIDIVAQSLAGQTRYNSHGVSEFYSVAEHSILASYLVDEEYAYEALMHDSSEAITGDMVAPLKQIIPEFKKIEEKVERRMADVFCYNYPYNPQVKKADVALWVIEKRWLFPNSKKTWASVPENPFEGLNIERIKIVEDIREKFGKISDDFTSINNILPNRFLSPKYAKEAFIRRYNELISLHV